MSKNTGNRFWIAAGVTAVGFALDLWSKSWAVQHLSGGAVKSLAGNILELVLLYNRAAVFGLDPRHIFPGFPVNLFFAVFTTLAIVVLVVYYVDLKKSEHLMCWGLATVLPGAVGNLFDRIAHPGRGVVDFIKLDLGFPPFDPWPVFNLADVWVTFGIGLMIAAFIRDERRCKKNAQTDAQQESGSPSSPDKCGLPG